ncbi:MAG: transposase [Anaerolineae bacterium]|mgnify:CR=1|jgi:putative transposase|nr:transposase [Anaerolineae bacterium]MBT7069956.1 transposase [Anaerolineae bacterium]MBT7326486.1 transposase [Anaerolineae bacterium]
MNEGVFYHIYNRGNNREKFFLEEENYHYFLKQYQKYLSGFVDTYAYCLMPTHFHFVLRIKETSKVSGTFEVSSRKKLTPLEKAFRDFFISYAKSINKHYDRTGSLFQYKFKRKPVANSSYLMRLILYVHANPIDAKLCSGFRNCRFSSYNAILGVTPTEIKRKCGFR